MKQLNPFFPMERGIAAQYKMTAIQRGIWSYLQEQATYKDSRQTFRGVEKGWITLNKGMCVTTVRGMAKIFRLSPVTVRRELAQFERWGLLQTIARDFAGVVIRLIQNAQERFKKARLHLNNAIRNAKQCPRATVANAPGFAEHHFPKKEKERNTVSDELAIKPGIGELTRMSLDIFLGRKPALP
jgi:DNA-binding transcriptional regulator YhcF (GntR family)